MKRAEYEKELNKLQVRLCHLQAWVKEKGLRIVILFEGRDGAGKGGTIRAITERLSPRVFRVVALPAPSDRDGRFPSVFPTATEAMYPAHKISGTPLSTASGIRSASATTFRRKMA